MLLNLDIKSIKNTKNEKDKQNQTKLKLTFQGEMWSDKSKAVNEVEKIFRHNNWLKPNLQCLQIPSARLLQKGEKIYQKLPPRPKDLNYPQTK